MAEREPGYYWVTVDADDADAWEVAEWRGDIWWLCGNDVAFGRDHIAMVGPRIELPVKKADEA